MRPRSRFWTAARRPCFARRVCGRPPTTCAPSATAPPPTRSAGAGGATWLPAAPADTLDRGDWWRLFDDAELNRLAAEVDAPTRRSPARSLRIGRRRRSCARRARRTSRPSRSAGGVHRSGGGGAAAARPTSTGTRRFDVSLGGDWAPDFWGRVGRAVEGARASAQASAADLAAARLSAQGELASDYFSLREADSEADLLGRTIEGYERALQITQNRYAAGVAPRPTCCRPRRSWRRRVPRSRRCAPTAPASSTRSPCSSARRRATSRRAGALERGRAGDAARRAVGAAPAPARHRLCRAPGRGRERADRRPARRLLPEPDARAPRSATAARASAICSSSRTRSGRSALSVAQTVFDAGAIAARVSAAEAARDVAVARYRQTVLAAFQGVEDQLANARSQAEQAALLKEASDAADRPSSRSSTAIAPARSATPTSSPRRPRRCRRGARWCRSR